jgi:hypothetical protein
MTEYILIFFGIYTMCMFKFIAGPVLGAAAGYSIPEMVLVTILGMMTTVVGLTYLGELLRVQYKNIFKPPKKYFTKSNRRIISIRKKFQPLAIAFIAPLIFSPIGGTIIMNSLGIKKRKILTYMLFSSIFWAIFFSSCIDLLLAIPAIRSIIG